MSKYIALVNISPSPGAADTRSYYLRGEEVPADALGDKKKAIEMGLVAFAKSNEEFEKLRAGVVEPALPEFQAPVPALPPAGSLVVPATPTPTSTRTTTGTGG